MYVGEGWKVASVASTDNCWCEPLAAMQGAPWGWVYQTGRRGPKYPGWVPV